MSSILARHKKPGAFEKLVNSLELTSPEKRDKIMLPMEAEDPVFMDRVRRSMLNFNELKVQNEGVIMEILFMVGKMEYIALALYKWDDKELVDKFVKCIPPKQMAEYREAVEGLAQVTKGQREGAQFKIVEIARKLQNEKGIKIKPYVTE